MENQNQFMSKKAGLFIGVAVIALLLIVSSWWVLMPKWQPVLGAAGSEEARIEALNYLMENNIPYQEDEATGYLLVESTSLTAVRNQLSQNGISTQHDAGLEIFAETEYGMSEFTQRINFQRAMEAELSHTIRSFADVKSARVHLTIPKESIFRDKRSTPKASVVIATKPGQVLTNEQVRGISQLVAASVDGMETNKVIVLDVNGNLLVGSEEAPGRPKSQNASNLELAYVQKAEKLVRGIVQTDQIQVAVNATLNYDLVKSVKEQIIPNEDNEGYVKSSRQNIVNVVDKSNSENSKPKENSSLEEEYIYTRERSEIEYASGQIEKISVGIVVTKSVSDATRQAIEDVVSSGLGLDMSRGDRITVVAVAPAVEEAPVLPTPNPIANINKPLNEQASNLTLFQKPEFFLSVIGALCVLVLILIAALLRSKPAQKPIQLSQDERSKLLEDARSWIAEGQVEKV